MKKYLIKLLFITAKRSTVADTQWDFHTRSGHPSTHPRYLPLAVTGIALSQLCCCSLKALHWIILICISPEELGVFLWQKSRKERMNFCWVFTPGQEQAHLPQQSPILSLYEQSWPQVWPTAPQKHYHRDSRTIPETCEPSAPALVSYDPLCQGLSSFQVCTANSKMQSQAVIRAPNPHGNKKNINKHNNLHCEEKSIWTCIASAPATTRIIYLI